jgi:GAF domain-containing protein
MTLVSRQVDKDLEDTPATVCPSGEDGAVAALSEMLRATSCAVPSIRHAALSTVSRGALPQVLASTGHLPRQLETLQLALGEGPTLDALRGNDPVVVVTTDDLNRWPDFGPRACALGLTSAVVARLRWNGRTLGAFCVYGVGEDPLPEAVVALSSAFATHAAATLALARKAEQLELAMLTRQQIGQAVGVLMERCGLTPDAAFSYLRRVSQTGNVKLRDVARGLIATGEMPLCASGRQRKSVSAHREV